MPQSEYLRAFWASGLTEFAFGLQCPHHFLDFVPPTVAKDLLNCLCGRREIQALWILPHDLKDRLLKIRRTVATRDFEPPKPGL